MNHSARPVVLTLLLAATVCTSRASAINITVDYRYDTTNFFNTQQKKDALEAAAARFSAIITTPLSAATLADDSIDPRIGFTHPSLGTSFDVSPANSAGSDAVRQASGDVAEEYRGPWSIAADEWILYAGARSLSSAGQAGTGTGLNFTSVFNDGNSHLNRGFRASGSVSNLPVWGGVIAFDNDGSTSWHFDLNTAAPITSIDFYTIALHEIGHALGLSTNWIEWTNWSSGGQFSGTAAVAAYNDDNNASLSALNEVSATDHHWQDGTYDSFIFHNASPNYIGTVGSGVLQDLLLEPTANFTSIIRRFELTNVDVAALVDIGWSVVPTIDELPGDFNEDGAVDAADYVVWRKGAATPGDYTLWRAHFGESNNGGAGVTAEALSAAVPEPPGMLLWAGIAGCMLAYQRRVKRGRTGGVRRV